MTSYLFVLGRTPALADIEIRAMFPHVSPESISLHCLLFPDMATLDPTVTIETLGGTVKIAEIIGFMPKVEAKTIAEHLLKDHKNSKITFGISQYDSKYQLPISLLHDVKVLLEEAGVSARFVHDKTESALSSVVIAKQEVTEIIVFPYQNVFGLARTCAVQDFESWNKRDYGRPHADAKAGMLPPKVARMAVNIALGDTVVNKTLFDPFCGMGTVLAEGLLRGATCIGSDVSLEMVDATKGNLVWLKKQYPEIVSSNIPHLFAADATHVSESIPAHSIHAIVTEPYMGSTQIALDRAPINVIREKVKDTVKGLEKLYIGCLREWSKILTPGGIIVMALPSYTIDHRQFFVKKVVDSCESLGYTTLGEPIEYGRPQAVVKRNFTLFKRLPL